MEEFEWSKGRCFSWRFGHDNGLLIDQSVVGQFAGWKIPTSSEWMDKQMHGWVDEPVNR